LDVTEITLIVGLWFAVSERAHADVDGIIYQLALTHEPEHIVWPTIFK